MPVTKLAVDAGRAVRLVLGLSVLGQLALVTGRSWFVFLGVALLVLMTASMPRRAALDGLVIEVRHAARVTAGEHLVTDVSVVNTGTRPSGSARICLHTQGLADTVLSIGPLGPGQRTTAAVERAATTRAVADSTVEHLIAKPAFGLLLAMREVKIDRPVIVHPPVHPVRLPAAARASTGRHSGATHVSSGPEVRGVREWRAGDDASQLHWRSTARSGRPTLLEREDDEEEELRVVLVGSDSDPDFEEALSLAASVCDRALATGRRLSVVAWHVGGPVLASAGSRVDLLDWWSTVHDTALPGADVFGQVLLAGFGPGDVFVVGTHEVDDEWLRAATGHCPGVQLRRLGPAT